MCAFLIIIMLVILGPSLYLIILRISVEETIIDMWATTCGGRGTISNCNHFCCFTILTQKLSLLLYYQRIHLIHAWKGSIIRFEILLWRIDHWDLSRTTSCNLDLYKLCKYKSERKHTWKLNENLLINTISSLFVWRILWQTCFLVWENTTLHANLLLWCYSLVRIVISILATYQRQCAIFGLNALIIQESKVLVFLSHAICNASPRAGSRIDPLTKPILFLASRVMIMLRDEVW